MLKKAVQQGRSERRGEAYSELYVEPLSEARTTLADFFSILLAVELGRLPIDHPDAGQNEADTEEFDDAD